MTDRQTFHFFYYIDVQTMMMRSLSAGDESCSKWQSEKQAAEKVCLSLMHQLNTRFSKIKSDYNEKIDSTVRELTAIEKAIESRANEFKLFTTGFEAMTFKPDRHLHYKVHTSCTF